MSYNDNISSDAAIAIERIIDAPVDLIWQIWTQPQHFKKWYGPQGFTVSVAKMDVRVGGKCLICMETQTPDGSIKIWTTGEYIEVVTNKRLVYTDSIADAHGNVIESDGDQPTMTRVTIVLEALGGRTKMLVTHAGVPANQAGASTGWEQSFAKMADYIEAVRKDK